MIFKRIRIFATMVLKSLFFVAAIGSGAVLGQTIPGEIVKAGLKVQPDALEFDVGNSKLYALINSGSSFQFGTIDTTKGKFTSIPLQGAAPTTLVGGTDMTIDSSSNRLFILRTDALVAADLRSGQLTTFPSPAFPNSGPSEILFDSQSKQLLAQTGSGIVSVNLNDGSLSSISRYAFTTAFGDVVHAIDPSSHTFYLEEMNGSQAELDAIDEVTGDQMTTNLPYLLVGLAFETSTKRLYGITACCHGSLPNKPELVRVFPYKVIGPVGDKNSIFYGSSIAALDEDNRLSTATFSPMRLVTTDVASNRSWYIEFSPTESLADLNEWMQEAGQSLGQRNAFSAQNESLVILDFGDQATKSGAKGATGFGHFLASADIQQAAEAFADGYVNGLGGGTTKLRLVIGTNSHGSNVDRSHGKNWGTIIEGVDQDFSGSALVQVAGGIDIETQYAPATQVSNWEAGFNGGVVDYGDLGGCPESGKYTTITSCSVKIGKITKSWSIGEFAAAMIGSNVVPEIYNEAESNAKQWHLLSKFMGGQLQILGPISQFGACTELGGEKIVSCDTLMNTPFMAWSQLTEAISSSFIASATDIEHRIAKKQSKAVKETTIAKTIGHWANVIAMENRSCGETASRGDRAAWASCRRTLVAKLLEQFDALGVYSRVVPNGELGIETDADAPGLKGYFDSWSGYLSGTFYKVLVGAQYANPSTGVIMIEFGGDHGPELYEIRNSGTLSIIGERKGMLVLTGETGRSYAFDLRSRMIANTDH